MQLINATDLRTSIRNGGSSKRRIVSDEQRRQILNIYAAGETGALPGCWTTVPLATAVSGSCARCTADPELDKVGMGGWKPKLPGKALDAHQTFLARSLKPLIGQTQPIAGQKPLLATRSSPMKPNAQVKSNKTLITTR